MTEWFMLHQRDVAWAVVAIAIIVGGFWYTSASSLEVAKGRDGVLKLASRRRREHATGRIRPEEGREPYRNQRPARRPHASPGA